MLGQRHLDRAFGAFVDELVHVGIARLVGRRRRPGPDDVAFVNHGDPACDALGTDRVRVDRQGCCADLLDAVQDQIVDDVNYALNVLQQVTNRKRAWCA